MDQLNTILFPTDFTEDAAQAYTYAVKIAAQAGTQGSSCRSLHGAGTSWSIMNSGQ